MKRCIGCGKDNGIDVKFCAGCGAAFPVAPPPPAKIFCSNCGKESLGGEKFCGGCGTALQARGGISTNNNIAHERVAQFDFNDDLEQERLEKIRHLSDKWAWTLACVPMIGVILELIIYGAVGYSIWIGIIIYFVLNTIFIILDIKELAKNEFFAEGWMWLGLLLVPIYLFIRVSKTKKQYGYAITWCALFVLSNIPDMKLFLYRNLYGNFYGSLINSALSDNSALNELFSETAVSPLPTGWKKETKRNQWGEAVGQFLMQTIQAEGVNTLGDAGKWDLGVAYYGGSSFAIIIDGGRYYNAAPDLLVGNSKSTTISLRDAKGNTQNFSGIISQQLSSTVINFIECNDSRLAKALEKNTTYTILVNGICGFDEKEWYVRASNLTGGLTLSGVNTSNTQGSASPVPVGNIERNSREDLQEEEDIDYDL